VRLDSKILLREGGAATQITRALAGRSVLGCLFAGMLCAVPAALIGPLLFVIRF